MAVKCKVFGHSWRIKQLSNVIQFDVMGYPLRLCICECKYCMKSKQMWIDSTECKNDVELQWFSDEYEYINTAKSQKCELKKYEKSEDKE